MAIINYTDQIKFAGKGYLDAKIMPVETVDNLYAIPRTQRFEGLTITVLNGGNPMDYWLVGGTSDSNWIPKYQSSGDSSKLEEKVAELSAKTESNTEIINTHTNEIKTLTERINALNGGNDYQVDNKTIGVSEGEEKTLYVKILNKEGNILKQDTNSANESGLFATIPVFFGDDELM